MYLYIQIYYRKANAEDLQVVNYKIGQKYDSHHDWGSSGYPESRLITLLLYLTDQVSNIYYYIYISIYLNIYIFNLLNLIFLK
jgi:hypothetical protein